MTPDRDHLPPALRIGSTKTAAPPPTVSQIIGGHRVLRVLGEGGMGIVYEAEQEDPRRPVALKVVRGGHYLDDHQVKLFQREAQTLARLKHPCIAAIYEAGRTDDGQHFFAMELVRGVPLMQYVESKKLSMRDRLELFRKICDAINYAHQRGVIHRDLKPSNILIDADGQPKILDFGLAKMTDADIAVTTVVTELGKIQGTLPYMSPEQARGNPDEIDLRSDVYSLGVILYQLLTGQLPYEVARAMLHEAVRVICEEAPRKPSTINRTLRGDVETIALKALEKEPTRRYQSASALSDDVERYLTDQPILARRPSAMYQFKKLIVRHKLPFAFAITLLFLIAAFAASVTSLLVQSEDRRKAAVRLYAALVAAKREMADFYESHGDQAMAAELRHQATLDWEEMILDPANPVARAALPTNRKQVFASPQLLAESDNYNVIARRMVEEKQWDDAEAALQTALKLAPENPKSWLYLAWMKLEYYAAQPDEAGPKSLEEAEAATRRVLEKNPRNITALAYQSVALRKLKRFPEAISTLKQALEIEPENYAQWSNLGALYLVMGDVEMAGPSLRRAADYASSGTDNHSYRARAWRNLAVLELFLQKSEAAKSIEKAIEFHELDALAWVIQARVQLELADHLNVPKALGDAIGADRAAKFRDPNAKRVLALAYLRNNEFNDAVTEARAAIALNDLPVVNHLIIAVAEAKRGQPAAAKEAMTAAEATWLKELREPGGFTAFAETGDLWIESADDLIRLKTEADAAIAVASATKP